MARGKPFVRREDVRLKVILHFSELGNPEEAKLALKRAEELMPQIAVEEDGPLFGCKYYQTKDRMETTDLRSFIVEKVLKRDVIKAIQIYGIDISDGETFTVS